MTPELQPMKQAARETWAKGEYQALAQFLPPAAAHLVRAAGIEAGDDVLDIACGTGITAITAARAGANVSALDLTPDLLALAEDEAALAGVDVAWQEGDAEALPYADASFDVVVSSFGHMFTPDPAAAAAELLRVTKIGGRIAFVTWPPDSVVGKLLKAVATVLPPPAGAHSPLQWGMEGTVTERLGPAVEDVRFEAGTVSWPALSPGGMWHLFRTSYGPFIAAMAKLEGEPDKQARLASDVQGVFAAHMQGNVVGFDYLLTRAVKA